MKRNLLTRWFGGAEFRNRPGARSARRAQLCLEELESRRQLDAAGLFSHATPLWLDSKSNAIHVEDDSSSLYAFEVKGTGRFSAEVEADTRARLTLRGADGRVLLQSDGQAPGQAVSRIDVHLAGTSAGTAYYLEVAALGGTAIRYTLTAEFRESLAPFRSLPAGTAPWSVATADFDRDGHLDLATANFHSNDVSILYGLGDGTFRAETRRDVGNGPNVLVSGDFNRDGFVDLATANMLDGTVSILYADGAGGFGTHESLNLGGSPSAVTAGDVNGDGFADLAVTDLARNQLVVMMGGTTGVQLGSAVVYDVGAGPYAVALADFDGDGHLDYVTANYDDGAVTMYYGLANGGVRAERATWGVGGGPYTLAVGDFNGDGRVDLASANFETNDVSVLMNQGGGRFAAEARYQAGAGASGIVTADFNRDGRLDLATANFSAGTASILLGRGDGTFTAARETPMGADPGSLAAGDFNADGAVDLAGLSVTPGDVHLLLNRGDGTFQAGSQRAPGAEALDLVAGDFNRDGRLDLVTINYATSDLAIFIGRGDGSYHMLARVATGFDVSAAITEDVNGDGCLDLIATSFSSPYVTVLLGRGDGTFSDPQSYLVGSLALRVAAADFNGDGNLDLATADLGSNTVSVLLGRGSQTSEPTDLFFPRTTFAVEHNPRDLKAADFDGDGVLDLVVAHQNEGTVSILTGNGQGVFGPPKTIATGGALYSIVTGELGGDAGMDFAVVDPDAGVVQIWINQGNASFSQSQSLPVGRVPVDIVVGDFDGRFGVDLAVVNRRDSSVNVLLRDERGRFASAGVYDVGAAPFTAVAADLNGDGKLDIASASFEGSTVTLLVGAGDGGFRAGPSIPIASGPAALALADFDSDGYVDVVTTNPTTGRLEVALMNGDGTVRRNVFMALDGRPAAVAAGDFNRDGRPDVAVARAASGIVEIHLGIGDGAFRTPRFISVGRHPGALTVGDVNRDGILDLACANFLDDTVSLLLGNGGGDFVLAQNVAVGQGPSAFAWSDLDADGLKELLVANTLSNSLSVLSTNGHLLVDALPEVALGFAPAALVAGDFDGDGQRDIAVANQANGSVHLVRGLSPRAFDAPRVIYSADSVRTIAASDFNNDGRMDLAVAGNTSVAILRQRGNGAFEVGPSYAVGDYPVAILPCDLNNDGRFGIVTANALGAPLSIGLGFGNGVLTQPGVGFPPVQSRPIIADLNRDGIDDVVVLAASGKILFRAGRAQPGRFDAPIIVNPGVDISARDINVGVSGHLTYLAAANARIGSVSFYVFFEGQFTRIATSDLPAEVSSHIQVGDLNGDGRDDLVMAVIDTGQLFVYYQREQETFADRSPDVKIDVGVGVADIRLADMNGDGFADILATDAQQGLLRVFLNRGDRPFAQSHVFRAGVGLIAVDASFGVRSRNAPSSFIVGQFSGDALPDVAVLNRDMHRVDLLRGAGLGSVYAPDPSASLLTGIDPVALASEDFNGDGHLDLAVLNRGSSDVSVYLGTAQGGFHDTRTRFGAGNSPAGLNVADFNRDGVPDLIVGNTVGDVLVLIGIGDGAFAPYRRADQKVALAVADFDQTGAPHFVLASGGGDRISVMNANFSLGFQSGREDGILSPNAVQLADLNRDSLPDLIVANGGGNNVLVYLGGGQGRFQNASAFFAGTNPEHVTIADFNSDGLLDLAVANQGSNDVSILLGQGSGDGWTLTSGPRLQAGAGPVATLARDLNADGLLDLLIVNRESNNIYQLHGIGGGFFNDIAPVIHRTGVNPQDVYVGHFDRTPGLDMVAVNGGSKDLSLFSNFGVGRKIALNDSVSVAAISRDFDLDGYDDLLVAGREGVFSLLVGAEGGLLLARTLAEGLVNVSDFALWGVTGSGIEMFVTLEGWEGTLSVFFDLGLATVALEKSTAGEASTPDRAEFVSLSPLEMVMVLFVAAKPTHPASDKNGERQPEDEPESDDANAGEFFEPSAEDDAYEHSESAAEEFVEGNALISGAEERRLAEWLETPNPSATDIVFPSPLEVFEAHPRGQITTKPSESSDEADSGITPRTEGVSMDPSPTAAESQLHSGAIEVVLGELAGTSHVETPKFSLTHLAALAFCMAGPVLGRAAPPTRSATPSLERKPQS